MKRRKRGGQRGVTDRGRPEEGLSPNGGPVRHIPVLLKQVMRALSPRVGERYIDGTFGAGGYARAILDAADCKVLGLDCDPSAIAAGRALERQASGRLKLAETSFSHMEEAAQLAGWDRVDGVVLDLGVSSMQLDEGDAVFLSCATGQSTCVCRGRALAPPTSSILSRKTRSLIFCISSGKSAVRAPLRRQLLLTGRMRLSNVRGNWPIS